MFNRAIRTQTLPKYLNSDHDPLYRFQPWQANLRVLEVQEITLRSAITSVCRAIDWDDSARGPGPNIILVSSRPGGQTASFPALFQQASHALGLGRKAARTGEEKVTQTSPPTGGGSIVADFIRHLRRRDFQEFAANTLAKAKAHAR